jgi:hypothetical protein
MTRIIDTTSKRRLSAKLGAGIAICAILALGTFAGTASARDRDDGGRHGGGWGGRYYGGPAVVYGSSYGYGYGYYGAPYYAPPVVYAPEVGISLPGVAIGIR